MACRGQNGFTLLAVLFLVAVMGLGLAALGVHWETARRREQEAQLLFAGDQYRRAITAYYEASPGPRKQYPAALRDLLDDKRFPHTVRHLRRLYVDPITGKAAWGLVWKEGGIAGVYSLSTLPPLKQADFALPDRAFSGARTYAEWVFAAKPPAANQTEPRL